jgi:class 3 adenylate cyclase/tetratricopeptide (TPR) repeat protein
MRCLRCQFENPPAMKFCGQCGTQLAQLCPRCGAENQPTFKFCGQCGTALTAPSPPGADTADDSAQLSRPPEAKRQDYTPPHLAEKILRARSALEGERRQVTVLFADMTGFTTLAEPLDPEEVHQIIDRCFELITAEVHRFEGTINQYTGDGVMALFGAPVAHEDSPRRAVHAALSMQRALRAYSEELQAQRGLALQMRIGLNTGLVVVGKIGDDLRMDYTAVGDTTNLAARLQQMARPGSVLVSEATHRAVGGFFETLDLGEMPVKGHTPVRAFEVLRPRGRRMRFDVAVERGLTPLVGRERELGLLLDRFNEVKAGRGQVVFITGEAGIGKSRLVLECRRALAAAGDAVTWLEGRCISFGESIPFLPIIDQLRENFGIQEFDGESEIIAKIEHSMRRMGEGEAHIPAIRYLLSVDPGDPAFAAMEAVARRRKIFEAVRALTLRGARLRPLVLVVEDLHWIDTSSEELLSSLMDAVAAVSLLLILTYRVEYTPPFGSRSFYTTLTLHSLSEAETATMASRVLGTAQFPQELRTALMEKAEGVPLFIEEVTKTLLDLGVLQRENGNYRLVKSLAEVSVPDTIQDIIMARLDRLGEDGKRTVQLASVIGRQFLVRLLERIAGLTGQLEGLLQELKTLEVIYELGLLPEPAYIFKHAVIQDVAYHSLLVQRRKELHRAVGYAIEELYPDRLVNHYEELAHHFMQGEAWEKAFDYLVLSGDKAKNAYANQTALDFYARALTVAPRVVPSVPARHIMEIYQRRGQVYCLLSRYPEAIAEAERMRSHAHSAGDKQSEGEALADLALYHHMTSSWEHIPLEQKLGEEALSIAQETGDERVTARSLIYLGAVDQVHGKLLEQDAKLKQALRIGKTRGFQDVIAPALHALGAAANWRGEFQRAITLCQQGERAAADIYDGTIELWAQAMRCLAHIGLGEYAEAITATNDGLTKARDRDNMVILGRLTNALGWLHQELGDFQRAIEYDRDSADLGQRTGISNVEISALINLGFDYLHLGEPEKALTLLETTLSRAEKGFGAHRWRWAMRLCACIADTLLVLGAPDRALTQVEQGFIDARATGSMKYIARFHALRGEIALAARQWSQAEADCREALRIARQISYPTLTWQAAHLLARSQTGQNNLEAAFATIQLAVETIDAVTTRIPDPALRETFLAWPRVQAIRAERDRLSRIS